MTIEVRQLLLKSRVSDEEDEDDAQRTTASASADDDEAQEDGCDDREQLKEEILAECRVWLLEQLQQLRER